VGLTRKYILLVEDNPDDEALALRALGRSALPADIVVARDGAEALELLVRPELERLPDVVLLDLKLPKLSGIDVLRRLRADPRTVLLPVVVLTSSGEDEDVRESYRAGANCYVRKPVDFDQFAAAVSELGHFWLMLSESPQRDGKPR
jgi:two-component system response regulator